MTETETPKTQFAVQLVGPGELRLNTSKEVFQPGERQILAKTEAVGLCFSDLKLLKQFHEHVRKSEITAGIERDILARLPSYVPGNQPTVPGHEVVLRVVSVGPGVTSHRVGDRFIVQADYRKLPTSGSNAAFGYNFEGALQEYVLLDERIIADERGQDLYVIPVGEELSAASVALVEPWACVECSYATPERGRIKPAGRTLVVADVGAEVKGLLESLDPAGRPESITAVVADEGQWDTLEALGVPLHEAASAASTPDEGFDDILYFGADPATIETLNDKIAAGGILNIILGGKRIGCPVSVGVGRIHYGPTRWVGTTTGDAADGYAMIPPNGEVRPNDRVVVIGAGGPMGQMHVIRDASLGLPGVSLLAADVDEARLEALSKKARPLAEANAVPYETVNTKDQSLEPGFTYYAIMAPVAAIAAEAIEKCAPGAIINLFAGIPAPVRHGIDLDTLIEKRVFVFGTSGSETEHMRIVLKKVTEGQLDTCTSVDAVSGMAGATEGLAAVENRTLAGKILVYPQLHAMPLTPLNRLAERYPTVAEKLDNGRWTKEAEEELLRVAG